MTRRAPLLLLALTALLALLPPGGVSVCPFDGTIALGGLAGCPCERDGGEDDDHGTCHDVHSPGLLAQAPTPVPAVDAPGELLASGAAAELPCVPPAAARRPDRPDRGPPPRPPAALAALATVRLRI